LAAIDAVVSLLLRRQRSMSTRARVDRAKAAIATQTDKPGDPFEPPEAREAAALVGGLGWPTQGGVLCVVGATGPGKVSVMVAGAVTSRVVAPDSAV
jgi:hypothetical protein